MAPQTPSRSLARPFRVDHAQLVRSGERLEVVADAVAALGAGVHELIVEHERDGRCCRTEPWPATQRRILDVVQRRRGRASVHVRLGDAG